MYISRRKNRKAPLYWVGLSVMKLISKKAKASHAGGIIRITFWFRQKTKVRQAQHHSIMNHLIPQRCCFLLQSKNHRGADKWSRISDCTVPMCRLRATHQERFQQQASLPLLTVVVFARLRRFQENRPPRWLKRRKTRKPENLFTPTSLASFQGIWLSGLLFPAGSPVCLMSSDFSTAFSPKRRGS